MEDSYNSNNYSKNITKQMGTSIFTDSQSNKRINKRHSSYTPINVFSNSKDKIIEENAKNKKTSSSKIFDKNNKSESIGNDQYNELNTEPSRSLISNENLILNSMDDTKLNMKRRSNRLSMSSFNNVMIENYSTVTKNHQNYDENGRNSKPVNNLEEYNKKRDSRRFSLYGNNHNSLNGSSPVIMEFTKDIKSKELSNRGSNSDISIHSQSRIRISKQGSSLSLNSNNIVSNNVEDDALLELSVNSLELLGSYLKNSNNENFNKSGLPLYEEKPLNYKRLSENNIGYYSKRNSSIVLPYLKLNEFIEDQDISETITSISKTWPVEKSGFVLRKMVYSNGVYKNLNSLQQDKKEITIPLGYKEMKISSQSKKKGKHKKNQSHDNYSINSINGNGINDGSENKDWDWGLFYVELRGQYLFFYRLYNTDAYWKKESHNKSKNKPGALENIRNVFVERIISFGRNKKNSNHHHPTTPTSIENSEESYSPKVHDNVSKDAQQRQQTILNQDPFPNNKTSTTPKRKSLNIITSQSKPTLQQQLLASQNIHPRENQNRNSSSISRSFTFANITTNNLDSHYYGQINSPDSNHDGTNSINLDMNPNSPSVQSSLPPHPTYSPSFSNRQYINSNSPGLSSPCPSPLNTTMTSSRRNSTSQMTPNSVNSPKDADYPPIVVPSIPNSNYPKNSSYSQITNSMIRHGSSPMVNSISNILSEDEESTIKEGMTDMNNILPPHVNSEGEGSSVISSPASNRNPKEINEAHSSLVNSTETVETKIITTNVTSQVISDIVDSYQQSDEDEQSDRSNNEINKSSTIKTTTTTTITTTSSILSTVSTIPSLSQYEKNQDSQGRVSPKKIGDSFTSTNQRSRMSSIEKSHDRNNDSFANISQLNRMSVIEKSQDSHIFASSSKISDSFANISYISRHGTVNNSMNVMNRKMSTDSTKSLKNMKRTKKNELSNQQRTQSPYLDSLMDDQVSTDTSLNMDQSQSFNQSINSIPSSVSSSMNVIASREMYTPERRQSKTLYHLSSKQSPTANKYNNNENSPSSLPPSTPMTRVTNNNVRGGNKHSSSHKQKHHSKITGKPILSLNDVNGPLDVLRAHRVLVHYIPLNYSIVEQLSYTENVNLKEGSIEKEVPLILLTYVNQDKIFSSACQVLLQMTNIGLGTVTNSSVTPPVTPTRLQKMESFNSDMHTPSTPLSTKRFSFSQNSPILPSGQMSNVSISSSVTSNSMAIMESIEKETQLIENEINDWSCHIQQSSNIIENPNMSYPSLGYDRFGPEDISPETLWNEERQIIDPNNYYSRNMNITYTNGSSRNIKSSRVSNSIPINNCQNETPNIKQGIGRSKSNRSFFSDIAPTFYEGNSISIGLDNNESKNESMINMEDPIHIEEKPTIEIKRKHKEINPTFMSHSLPYDYKALEVMKSSPFISSPGTRSLDDGRIEPPTEDVIGGTSTEKSSPYPIVTDISEIKTNSSLKVPYHNEVSSTSSITTLISQESNKSKQSKLNAIYEESFSKEQINNDRELYSFEVVKSKDKELGEGNTSVILPKTPSMVCEEQSSMLSGDIVNNNANSLSNGNSNKMINFDGNMPLNTKSTNTTASSNNNINANTAIYMNITPPQENSSTNPPQIPQKSIKRIKENEMKIASNNPQNINSNSLSDDMYIDVNNIYPARKTSLIGSLNVRNQMKMVKISPESPSTPLRRTNESIPSPASSLSSFEFDKASQRKNSDSNNLNVPIQKQPLLKPKSKQGKEHKNYPRRESLKIQHTVVMDIDKKLSTPTVSQSPVTTSPFSDIYNIGPKEDYKMESMVKDNHPKKKSPLFKIKEKVQEKEKSVKPNMEELFSEAQPRRLSIKDELKNKKKEKENEEKARKYSKELEKKQQKEKEALKKKNKKEAKREKKEKKIEEKQEKKHQDKLKISSPQPISTEEYESIGSPSSTKSKKEKSKKSPWYQLALSKLPTKSSNQSKKSSLFSDFKKGDTNTEILIKRTPTCSSHTSVRRRVINSNRASVCTNGTTNTVSSQASIPYASQFDALPEVPAILTKCIALIEEIGLETEGLYRISGNSSNVQSLLKLFQHQPDKIELLPPGNEPPKSSSRKTFKSSSSIPPPSSNLYKDSKFLYDNDIHVVTGCIKSWLRNGIPPNNEPLWPYHMYDDLIKASQMKDYTTRMIAFQDLVHALPPKNFTALNFLFEHLFKVSTYADQNKMTISNLAIIFGPTLLKSPPDSQENELMIITRMPFQCKAVEVLIEQYEWLFGPIEYEEESIDDEDLGIELINSSFQDIHGEIKDNEVVILKNTTNNDIDVVVSTTDKLGIVPIRTGDDEPQDLKEMNSMSSTVDHIHAESSLFEETIQEVDSPKYKITEDHQDGKEEPSERQYSPRKEKNFTNLEREAYGSSGSHKTYGNEEQVFNDPEMSSFENEQYQYNEREVQGYPKSMSADAVQRMKRASEELFDLVKDDDNSDKSSKGSKKKDKDKGKVKIKNSSSSNRLKQLLSRPKNSKKSDSDMNGSNSFSKHSDFKALISSPISVHQNSGISSPSSDTDKFILDNMNKNPDPLNYNKNEKNIKIMNSPPSYVHDIENPLLSSNVNLFKRLSENKYNQMMNESNGSENDFSERTLISHGSNDSNRSKEKRKGKGLSQKVSNSSMRIFQEQFLMDGFENDLESSLNDFLSKKYDDDEINSIINDKDEANKLKKNSIIRLSTQMTAKWNLELEKHLEQIYKDKKKSKLFINDDFENVEEKLKDITSPTRK